MANCLEYGSCQLGGALSEPGNVMLRVEIDDEAEVVVSDFVGLRHGVGVDIPTAVDMWWHAIDWLTTEPLENIGEPLLSEAKAYRRALRREES